MARYPSNVTYQFGPGGLTPAVRMLLIANVAVFLAIELLGEPRWLIEPLGLTPSDVVTRGWIWQIVTYQFLHAGVFHILFNMLSLWMFGVELERHWGTPFFTRYYFVTGIGAGLSSIAVSLLPFDSSIVAFNSMTVGASGAIFGLLLAYGITFPERPIYLYFLFQVPAKYFVMIVGAVALLASINPGGSNVSHIAHLGGIVVGYVYLRGFRLGRLNLLSELKYRYLKWKINRMRRKFDVHPGGRTDDWDRKIH
jgi:membrane associated rhomboid family serine protease